MSMAGVFTEYALTPYTYPEYISVGPDGALWFTSIEYGKIGRIAPGSVTVPGLRIVKTHSSVFFAGQQGAQYTLML